MAVLYDRLYRSDCLESDDLDVYLSHLVGAVVELFRFPRPPRLTLSLPGLRLSPEALSTLGIIINELVTNSLKYAVRDATDPFISLAGRAGQAWLELSYTDCGPGLPEGFDFANSGGFGTGLIAALVKQLDGSIVAEAGGCIRILLPLDEKRHGMLRRASAPEREGPSARR